MYKHILVPLDGSSLAEAALPAAAYLARMLHARVTLIHIIEQDAAATIHGERHLTAAEESEKYLKEVACHAFTPEITVEYHVHVEATSNVPRAIVEHQSELSPDLIVMCTHGKSGFRKVLFGDIAQQVVASGNLPLLLIRPGEAIPPKSFSCDLVLAPTDGDPVHEQGLIVACQLAHITGAKLRLLSVVPTTNVLSGRDATTQRFMPGTTSTMLDMAEEELRAYLQQQMEQIQPQGVAVFAEVRRGEPAAVIAEVAETFNASLIVLGTHGKIGTKAFWNDSIGAKVVTQTKRPLLLIPVKTA
jgi:nucleotide-binding universal stress UspA family protein